MADKMLEKYCEDRDISPPVFHSWMKCSRCCFKGKVELADGRIFKAYGESYGNSMANAAKRALYWLYKEQKINNLIVIDGTAIILVDYFNYSEIEDYTFPLYIKVIKLVSLDHIKTHRFPDEDFEIVDSEDSEAINVAMIMRTKEIISTISEEEIDNIILLTSGGFVDALSDILREDCEDKKIKIIQVENIDELKNI